MHLHIQGDSHQCITRAPWIFPAYQHYVSRLASAKITVETEQNTLANCSTNAYEPCTKRRLAVLFPRRFLHRRSMAAGTCTPGTALPSRGLSPLSAVPSPNESVASMFSPSSAEPPPRRQPFVVSLLPIRAAFVSQLVLLPPREPRDPRSSHGRVEVLAQSQMAGMEICSIHNGRAMLHCAERVVFCIMLAQVPPGYTLPPQCGSRTSSAMEPILQCLPRTSTPALLAQAMTCLPCRCMHPS